MAEAIEGASNIVETNIMNECLVCHKDFQANQDAILCGDCNGTLGKEFKSSSNLTDAEVAGQLDELLSPLGSNNNNRCQINQTEKSGKNCESISFNIIFYY